jgi:hypothetical protein
MNKNGHFAIFHYIILQELDPKLGFDLIKQFTSIVGKVIGAIKNGVEAFKRIISTDFSLKDIVDDFVKAVTEIPEKVFIFKEYLF